jgi:hypothetical protein
MREKTVPVGSTCATCKRGNLSSNLKECVDCLKKDKPGNRFPNWELKEEK